MGRKKQAEADREELASEEVTHNGLEFAPRELVELTQKVIEALLKKGRTNTIELSTLSMLTHSTAESIMIPDVGTRRFSPGMLQSVTRSAVALIVPELRTKGITVQVGQSNGHANTVQTMTGDRRLIKQMASEIVELIHSDNGIRIDLRQKHLSLEDLCSLKVGRNSPVTVEQVHAYLVKNMSHLEKELHTEKCLHNLQSKIPLALAGAEFETIYGHEHQKTDQAFNQTRRTALLAGSVFHYWDKFSPQFGTEKYLPPKTTQHNVLRKLSEEENAGYAITMQSLIDAGMKAVDAFAKREDQKIVDINDGEFAEQFCDGMIFQIIKDTLEDKFKTAVKVQVSNGASEKQSAKELTEQATELATAVYPLCLQAFLAHFRLICRFPNHDILAPFNANTLACQIMDGNGAILPRIHAVMDVCIASSLQGRITAR